MRKKQKLIDSNEKDTFVLYHNKTFYTVLTFILTLVVTLFTCMLAFSIDDIYVGAFLILIWTFLCFWWLMTYHNVFKQEYLMIIDEKGITTPKTGLIMWRNIYDIYSFSYRLHSYIGIKIRNEEEFLRDKKPLYVLYYKLRRALYDLSFVIDLVSADSGRGYDAIAEIERRCPKVCGSMYRTRDGRIPRIVKITYTFSAAIALLAIVLILI